MAFTSPNLNDHPRIWVTNNGAQTNNLTAVKARVAAGGSHVSYWNSLQTYVAANLNNPSTFWEGITQPEQLGALAFSYLLKPSANQSHANTAISQAVSLSGNPILPTDTNEYIARMVGLAMVYDWCFSLATFTSTEKAAIRIKIAQMVGDVVTTFNTNQFIWGESIDKATSAIVALTAILSDGTSTENTTWSGYMTSLTDWMYENATPDTNTIFAVRRYFADQDSSRDGGNYRGLGPQSAANEELLYMSRLFPVSKDILGLDYYTTEKWYTDWIHWFIWGIRNSDDTNVDSAGFFRQGEHRAQSIFTEEIQHWAHQIVTYSGTADATMREHAQWLVELIDSVNNVKIQNQNHIWDICFRSTTQTSVAPTLARYGGDSLYTFNNVSAGVYREGWGDTDTSFFFSFPKFWTGFGGGRAIPDAGHFELNVRGKPIFVHHGFYDPEQNTTYRVDGSVTETGHRYTYGKSPASKNCLRVYHDDEITQNEVDTFRRTTNDPLTRFGDFNESTGVVDIVNSGNQVVPKGAGGSAGTLKPLDLDSMLNNAPWDRESGIIYKQETSQFAYAVGDIQGWYWDGKCTSFRRHFLFIKPGEIPSWSDTVILIFDELTTTVDTANYGKNAQRYGLNTNAAPTEIATGSVLNLQYTSKRIHPVSGSQIDGPGRCFHLTLLPTVEYTVRSGAQLDAATVYAPTTSDPYHDSASGISRTDINKTTNPSTDESWLHVLFPCADTTGSGGLPSVVLINETSWVGATIGGLDIRIRRNADPQGGSGGGGGFPGSAHKAPVKLWRGTGKQMKDFEKNGDMDPDPLTNQDLIDELARISKYDMVSPLWVQRQGGTHANVYTHLRNLNPYIIIMEYCNPKNWAGNIFSNTSLTDPVSIFGLNERQAYLHYPYNSSSSGDRINPRFHGCCENNPMYNLANNDFINWFADQIVASLNKGSDGFWYDNAGIPPTLFTSTRQNESTTNPDGSCNETTCGKRLPILHPDDGHEYTTAEQNSEMITLAQTVYAKVIASRSDWLSDAGNELHICPNLGSEMGFNTTYPGGYHEVDDLAYEYGGGANEGSGWFCNKLSEPYDVEDSPLTTATWKGQVEAIRYILGKTGRAGKKMKYFLITKSINEVNGVPVKLWPGKSRILFSYGSFLLAAGTVDDGWRAYYNYHGSGIENTANPCGWGGYQVDIGKAIGSYYKVAGTNNIYARDFSNGRVYVNPSDTAETVNPNASYQRMDDDNQHKIVHSKYHGLVPQGGTTSANLTVGAYTGEILVFQNLGSVQFEIDLGAVAKVLTPQSATAELIGTDPSRQISTGSAPAAPTNLVAQPGSNFVQLDWDANTEPDLHPTTPYHIYRRERTS